MDFSYLNQLEELLNKANQDVAASIKRVMDNPKLTDAQREELMKAKGLTQKAREDLQNYKNKLKNDFNI